MNEEIIEHFRRRLLETPSREMQSDRSIKEIYNQPERSKREDDIEYFPIPCEKCKEYIHIDDQVHRFRCGALNTMET